MSWLFPDADTYAVVSPGALPQNGAPISVWWLIRPTVASFFGVYLGLEGGSDRLGINSVVGLYFTAADGTGGPAPVLNEWQVIGYDDDNAGGGTVRWHICTNLSTTPTWSHSNGTSGGDRSGLVDALRIGTGPGAFRMRGNIAAGAITAGRLGDAGFEALGVTSMATWVAAADLAWQCNVTPTATSLVDLTGGTANQTSLVGTPTLDTGQEPPNWTYFDGAATVEGTAASALGRLTGTAAGVRAAVGTAAANLGRLTGAAAGVRELAGSAVSNLGALTAHVTTPPPPTPDQFIVPLMQELLSCLCENAAAAPNPPGNCCFRVGTEIAHDAGINVDQCCEGIGYVALGDTYPSSDSFPEQDVVRQANSSCAPPTWAQAFKIGLIRCIPVGNEFEPPSCDVWNAAALQNIYDAQTLRRTACCMRNFVVNNSDLFFGMSVVIERQVQGNPQGGCVERYFTMTIQFPNLCDGC